MTATATIVIRNNGLISTQFSRPMNPMLDSAMSQALARINQAIRSAAARLRLTPCFDSLRTQGISGSALGFELQYRSKDGLPLNHAGHMTVRLCDDHLPQIGVEFHPGMADSERSLRALAHDCIQEAFSGQQREDWRPDEKSPRCGHSEGTEKRAGDDSAHDMDSPELLRRQGRRGLVYLAGPYSAPEDLAPEVARHLEDERARQHVLAGEWLKRQGWDVLSPIAMGHAIRRAGTPESAGAFDSWATECLTMLAACDVMLVLDLPGLTESRGVDRELGHAARRAMPVHLMTPEVPGQSYTLTDLDVASWGLLKLTHKGRA